MDIIIIFMIFFSESFPAIYMGPKGPEDEKVPLIVWPHGGPHSGFVDAYSLESAFFRSLGKKLIMT